MKTYFEEPEINVISFSVEEIMSTSGLEENELPMVPMGGGNSGS